jgi:23S rRNA pseudouridine1911/1915/1917 synthase
VLNTVFEDSFILVLSKPPGQIVNRAQTTKGKITLQDELEKRFGIKKSEEGIGGRAGIVHRLDKGTSGIILVAKTQSAFDRLQSQFKNREVRKEYLALAHGKAPKSGRIKEAIDRNPKNRMRFAVVPGGRKSVTEYETLNYYKHEDDTLSLIKVKPLTGRTHQIRVHLRHIGHPVVCDRLYLSRRKLRKDQQFCPRLFLHALALSFVHPGSGARMRLEAELPSDLQTVLDSLSSE